MVLMWCDTSQIPFTSRPCMQVYEAHFSKIFNRPPSLLIPPFSLPLPPPAPPSPPPPAPAPSADATTLPPPSSSLLFPPPSSSFFSPLSSFHLIFPPLSSFSASSEGERCSLLPVWMLKKIRSFFELFI